MNKTEEFIASFKALLKRYNAKLYTSGNGYSYIDSAPESFDCNDNDVYVDLESLAFQMKSEEKECK